MELIFDADGFDWDAGNANKSRLKHGVTVAECEDLFFNEPLLVMRDIFHSKTESRFIPLGPTEAGRRLFTAFTLRGKRVRVISARVMSRKERAIYEKAEEKLQSDK